MNGDNSPDLSAIQGNAGSAPGAAIVLSSIVLIVGGAAGAFAWRRPRHF